MGWRRYIPALAVWVVSVAGLLAWQESYETTPGTPVAPPEHWPAELDGLARPGRPIVVMALHPRCPCSGASLKTLADIAPGAGGHIDFVVLACVPENRSSQWTDSGTCGEARKIPGVGVILDHRARAATRLGMQTSGAVVAYGASGRLAFRGGITASRGQEGGKGALALRHFVEQHGEYSGAPAGAPVFGCALVGASCGGCDR